MQKHQWGIDANDLLTRVRDHSFWVQYVQRVFEPSCATGLHVAVLAEPFLTLVIRGEKTVESRFTQVRCPPFGDVGRGDVIMLKRVAGPICGLAIAHQAWFYDLRHEPLDRIRETYGKSICADAAFWEQRRDASYGTLIELSQVIGIRPFAYAKRDRRGWVSLRSHQLALL